MKLLILDLDETLVHACKQELDRESDFVVGQYHIYVRPHLSEFLEYAFDNFTVAVWTSAGFVYASGVVERIVPEHFKLEFLWSNERCTRRVNLETCEEYWIKNLKKVKKRGFDLDQVIMVDDTAKKLSRNYGNHIRLSEYHGQEKDDELLALIQYLTTIRDKDNFRTIEKRGWRSNLIDYSS